MNRSVTRLRQRAFWNCPLIFIPSLWYAIPVRRSLVGIASALPLWIAASAWSTECGPLLFDWGVEHTPIPALVYSAFENFDDEWGRRALADAIEESESSPWSAAAAEALRETASYSRVPSTALAARATRYWRERLGLLGLFEFDHSIGLKSPLSLSAGGLPLLTLLVSQIEKASPDSLEKLRAVRFEGYRLRDLAELAARDGATGEKVRRWLNRLRVLEIYGVNESTEREALAAILAYCTSLRALELVSSTPREAIAALPASLHRLSMGHHSELVFHSDFGLSRVIRRRLKDLRALELWMTEGADGELWQSLPSTLKRLVLGGFAGGFDDRFGTSTLLQGLRQGRFTGLEELALEGNVLRGFFVAEFPRALRRLSLKGSSFVNAYNEATVPDLAQLSNLSQLELLDLTDLNVTGTLFFLKRLPRTLRFLNLSRLRGDSPSFGAGYSAHLAEALDALPELETLDVSGEAGTPLTDELLRHVTPKIRRLVMRNIKQGSAWRWGWGSSLDRVLGEEAGRLPNLELLDVRGTLFTGSAIPYLPRRLSLLGMSLEARPQGRAAEELIKRRIEIYAEDSSRTFLFGDLVRGL